MINVFETKDFLSIEMIGNRVLTVPATEKDRTKSGLYLPEGVHEKEKILSGYAVKTGTGYPVSFAGNHVRRQQKSKIKNRKSQVADRKQ
jgi:co-chaperonin GroES (HSP10)